MMFAADLFFVMPVLLFKFKRAEVHNFPELVIKIRQAVETAGVADFLYGTLIIFYHITGLTDPECCQKL